MSMFVRISRRPVPPLSQDEPVQVVISESEDGAKGEDGLHLALANDSCSLDTLADGQVRCVPPTVHPYLYGDYLCRVKAVVFRTNCGTAFTVARDFIGCPPVVKHYRLGPAVGSRAGAAGRADRRAQLVRHRAERALCSHLARWPDPVRAGGGRKAAAVRGRELHATRRGGRAHGVPWHIHRRSSRPAHLPTPEDHLHSGGTAPRSNVRVVQRDLSGFEARMHTFAAFPARRGRTARTRPVLGLRRAEDRRPLITPGTARRRGGGR